MWTALGMRVVEGFVRPRRSMSRLLAAKPDWLDVIQLALLAFALNVIMRKSMLLILEVDPFLLGAGNATEPLRATLISQFAIHGAFIFMASGLAFGIGRAFGGKGDPIGVTIAVTWHTVITSFLVPLQMLAIPRIDGAGGAVGGHAGLMMIVVAITLWLLASYIATAHGFRSVLVVMMTIFGVGLILMLVFGSFFLTAIR